MLQITFKFVTKYDSQFVEWFIILCEISLELQVVQFATNVMGIIIVCVGSDVLR